MKNKKLFAILTLLCFLFTLVPVAAFAADNSLSSSASVIQTVDSDASVTTAKDDKVKIVFAINDRAGNDLGTTGAVYVWVTTTENGTVPADALAGADEDGILELKNVETGVAKEISFLRTGTFYIHAAFEAPTFENGRISAAKELSRTSSKNSVEVSGTAVDPEKNYKLSLTQDINNAKGYLTTQTLKDIVPNNVAKEITVTFFDGDKKMAAGKTVTIDTNSANIAVNKTSETTDLLGQITFKVSASREGVYYVYLTVDGVEFRLEVGSTNTSAAYIATEDQPTAPIAQYEKLDADVTFTVTDINGNIVRNAAATDPQGMNGIFKGNNTKVTDYLFFVEKPAASKLKDKDLKLTYNADDQVYELSTTSTLDAEGTYTVKAILDNGAFATATFEVKRFGTPVTLYIECARNVELGKHMIPELKYVDANGVTKAANDATMSATGYAIYSLMDSNDYNTMLDAKATALEKKYGTNITEKQKAEVKAIRDAKIAANKYAVNIKTDEKYVGTTVTYVATSERYNLVGTAEVKIGSAATDIAFEDKALAVNANNDVVWNVVDADGNKVKLDSTSARVINYVVLDKPEGAKVSVYDKTKANFNGEGKMAVTSNKVGNVTIQAVCQVRVSTDGNDTLGATQTKYYTGTKIFAVGTEGVGKVVVMSIGSNEIIVNDAKATIDAAPIVENNRTFVPFRALAEAFGATVAYDEATQAVTAELNGTTVVMTIGSATYTVNGVEKTADVAPFINGSRTMVPVRFAAEAFGIKVIPTYDENGATADILFNL